MEKTNSQFPCICICIKNKINKIECIIENCPRSNEDKNTYKMHPAYKSKKRRRAELRHHPEFREYAENMRQHIVTTRFNSDTWRENEEYRKDHPSFGSIYGTPELVNSNYKEKSVLFVLEMNNRLYCQDLTDLVSYSPTPIVFHSFVLLKLKDT